MRTLRLALLGCFASIAGPAALAAQADLSPTPIVLPVAAAAPRHAAAASAVKRGTGPRAASDVARTADTAANQVSLHAQAQAASQALAHQAQAAAAAAAGQAQSQAAKDRATHPHR
ncbi:MAG: hypothetical protein E6J90_18970 [Deltaproteobacteria bacterium]|nr:MAG: hypothetical protein E6J90_18970 [Deltaproteobacteria bacterium]